jgi:uncharacterized protein YndB with AHSA1/START domain
VADYSFLTTWVFDAPIERVWDALYDSERWPEWWRGVERVQVLERGGEDRVGELSRYTWKSKLPYRLEFDMRTTRVEEPHLVEGAAKGELTGTGRWRLFSGQDGTTAVTYEWNVETTARWMNALAPLARPVFAWNHDYVMHNGAEGLARRLGARLLVASGG